MNTLNKLQNLSEKKKKIILWSIIIIFALFLFKIYIQNAQKNIEYLEREKIEEEFKIPELKERLKGLFEFKNLKLK